MSTPQGLERVRDAKRRFAQTYQRRGWCRGIGIAPRGAGYVLRVNVDSGSGAAADVPEVFEGVPVEAVHIGGYQARSAGE